MESKRAGRHPQRRDQRNASDKLMAIITLAVGSRFFRSSFIIYPNDRLRRKTINHQKDGGSYRFFGETKGILQIVKMATGREKED